MPVGTQEIDQEVGRTLEKSQRRCVECARQGIRGAKALKYQITRCVEILAVRGNVEL